MLFEDNFGKADVIGICRKTRDGLDRLHCFEVITSLDFGIVGNIAKNAAHASKSIAHTICKWKNGL